MLGDTRREHPDMFVASSSGDVIPLHNPVEDKCNIRKVQGYRASESNNTISTSSSNSHDLGYSKSECGSSPARFYSSILAKGGSPNARRAKVPPEQSTGLLSCFGCGVDSDSDSDDALSVVQESSHSNSQVSAGTLGQPAVGLTVSSGTFAEPVTEQEVSHAFKLLKQASHLSAQQMENYESLLDQMRPWTKVGYRKRGDYVYGIYRADAALSRQTLSSILVDIEPFDAGKALSKGWYSKDIKLNRVSSFMSHGPTEGACSRDAIQRGQLETFSSPASSSHDRVPTHISVRVLYAKCDQVSEGAEAACCCIALRVAHHLASGKGASEGSLTSLVQSGGTSWKAMCRDPSVLVQDDGHMDFSGAMRFWNLSCLSIEQQLHEVEEVYCQIGSNYGSASLWQLVEHARAAASAPSHGGSAMAVYVMTCNRHTTTVAFFSDGMVWQVNSLGRSLENSCRVAHLLEFKTGQEFCLAYEHANRPSSCNPVQVEAHRVSLDAPTGEVAFHVFMQPA